ncbi:MAG: precorrin-8X methylmutase, partial [Candidatus Bathyarchaeia archaeon]
KIVRSRIEAEARLLTQEQSAVVERIVHATADPEYAKLTFITKDAVSAGITAVENGNPIVTDVEMVKAGLTRDRLKEFSIKVLTYIDDPRSSEAARIQGTTRAAAAMSVAASEGIDGCIIAIGNAPTAATQIAKLVNEGKVKPSVIVATPVGFVGAAKAKEEVSRLRTPHIIVSGEKGGSSAAAAAVNAFLALASDKKKLV